MNNEVISAFNKEMETHVLPFLKEPERIHEMLDCAREVTVDSIVRGTFVYLKDVDTGKVHQLYYSEQDGFFEYCC